MHKCQFSQIASPLAGFHGFFPFLDAHNDPKRTNGIETMLSQREVTLPRKNIPGPVAGGAQSP